MSPILSRLFNSSMSFEIKKIIIGYSSPFSNQYVPILALGSWDDLAGILVPLVSL